MQYHPVFEFLSVESLIKERQVEYYRTLGESDKKGQSTPFITYMLEVIDQSLSGLLNSGNVTLTGAQRVELFKEVIGDKEFTRKEFLRKFKDISSATASRDLKEAVDKGVLKKSGDKRTTRYRFL